MLRFCGFDLELLIDDVISRDEWPALCGAHDEGGANWLIVQVDDDEDHPAWLCAPLSARAIQAVLEGRASPDDVLRHSATGTVELVTVDHGRAVPDRCLLCSEIGARPSSAFRRWAGPQRVGPEGAGPDGARLGEAGADEAGPDGAGPDGVGLDGAGSAATPLASAGVLAA
jgi:hypothetical protein